MKYLDYDVVIDAERIVVLFEYAVRAEDWASIRHLIEAFDADCKPEDFMNTETKSEVRELVIKYIKGEDGEVGYL